jgi:hypothetical protein
MMPCQCFSTLSTYRTGGIFSVLLLRVALEQISTLVTRKVWDQEVLSFRGLQYFLAVAARALAT